MAETPDLVHSFGELYDAIDDAIAEARPIRVNVAVCVLLAHLSNIISRQPCALCRAELTKKSIEALQDRMNDVDEFLGAGHG